MIRYSIARNTTIRVETPEASRRPLANSENIQAQVRLYATMEMANLSGFSQIGAPSSTRLSTTSPTRLATVATAITPANTNIGRCHPYIVVLFRESALTAH